MPAISTSRTCYIPISALKLSIISFLSAWTQFLILITVFNLSTTAPVDSFFIYFTQLLSIKVKSVVHMQISSIRSIYEVDIHLSNTRPAYLVQISLFIIDLLVTITFIITNYISSIYFQTVITYTNIGLKK